MSLFDYDSLTIVGRAGKDAEMRFLPGGDPVTSFSVAVDRSYKKNGELHRRTIWYKISVFGKFAETCSSIKKGERVLVEGTLTPDDGGNPRIWTKSDGGSATSFEVNAQVVRFLSDRKDTEAAQPKEEPPF